ncbi:MAG: hypothetical protein U0359_03305 [Byssovorax sp.]
MRLCVNSCSQSETTFCIPESQRTAARGQRQHDALGRVTRIDDGDGTTRFAWDASPDGVIQDFGYDALGRPVHQAWTVDGSTYAFDEGYDAFGRPSSLSYPAIPGKPALLVERHYNAFGYHDGVTDPDKELWHADARSADGALLQGKLGNGLTIERTYQDDTGRLSTLTEGKALALTYDYDFDGAVQHRQDLIDQRFEAFDYDSRGRQDQAPARTVGYPERDLPRLITTEAGQTHFAYDASGQRVGNGARRERPHVERPLRAPGARRQHRPYLPDRGRGGPRCRDPI